MSKADAHEIWVAAQCRPDEGIIDAVKRIEEILNEQKCKWSHDGEFYKTQCNKTYVLAGGEYCRGCGGLIIFGR
jgi:hypothetical protein